MIEHILKTRTTISVSNSPKQKHEFVLIHSMTDSVLCILGGFKILFTLLSLFWSTRFTNKPHLSRSQPHLCQTIRKMPLCVVVVFYVCCDLTMTQATLKERNHTECVMQSCFPIFLIVFATVQINNGKAEIRAGCSSFKSFNSTHNLYSKSNHFKTATLIPLWNYLSPWSNFDILSFFLQWKSFVYNPNILF